MSTHTPTMVIHDDREDPVTQASVGVELCQVKTSRAISLNIHYQAVRIGLTGAQGIAPRGCEFTERSKRACLIDWTYQPFPRKPRYPVEAMIAFGLATSATVFAHRPASPPSSKNTSARRILINSQGSHGFLHTDCDNGAGWQILKHRLQRMVWVHLPGRRLPWFIFPGNWVAFQRQHLV